MIRCLKNHIEKVVEGVCAGNLFFEMPTVHFFSEEAFCFGNNKVLKTREKKVVTLDIGAFRAKETIMQSEDDGKVYTCQELKSLAPHRCTFGYDVIVYVGYALFVHCRSEKDIVRELALKNISISDREVSFLGKKFVTYLAVAHRESHQKIRSAMDQRGGYILHVDGTCEGDSPHLFTGLDGIAEIVLDNIKIPSERSELLIPFFAKIKEQYGDPMALVHDMGKGILTAIAAVFPGKPDFICHFHFLRDIGKDLMEDEYKKIRNRLKKHKIRGSLRRMAKSLERTAVQDRKVMEELNDGIKNGDLTTCAEMSIASAFALIQWVFDISAELNGYGFPFDLPHLVFYHRLKTVYALVETIWDSPHKYEKTHKPLHKLFRLIKPVMDDQILKRSAKTLDEKSNVFNALRKALRIALPEGKNGLNDDGDDTDMKTIKEKVEAFQEKLKSDETFSNSDEYKKMIEQIDTYWDKLFADPISVHTATGERLIQPQRTNNILERFFRDLKRKSRKKTGTISLNKTLKTILSDTPLVKNLDNKEYLDIILDGCDTLEQRFARVHNKLVLQELDKKRKETGRLPQILKKMIREPAFPRKLGALFGC